MTIYVVLGIISGNLLCVSPNAVTAAAALNPGCCWGSGPSDGHARHEAEKWRRYFLERGYRGAPKEAA